MSNPETEGPSPKEKGFEVKDKRRIDEHGEKIGSSETASESDTEKIEDETQLTDTVDRFRNAHREARRLEEQLVDYMHDHKLGGGRPQYEDYEDDDPLYISCEVFIRDIKMAVSDSHQYAALEEIAQDIKGVRSKTISDQT